MLDINYYGDMETQLFTVIITCRPTENCKCCLMQAKFSETSVLGTYTVVKASPVLSYNVITNIGLAAYTTTMYPKHKSHQTQPTGDRACSSLYIQ